MSLKNRTKAMFADAMMELSKTKSISSISVTDLVNYCDVNRYTFYYHFKDKYDLLLYIMVNQVKKGFRQSTDDDSIMNTEQLSDMLLFMKENKYFFKSAFSDDSPYSLLKSWYQFNLGLYRGMFRRALQLEQLPEDLDASIRIICFGSTGLVIDWLQSDCQEPPEHLVRYMKQSCYNLFGSFDGQVSLKQSFHHYMETMDE